MRRRPRLSAPVQDARRTPDRRTSHWPPDYFFLFTKARIPTTQPTMDASAAMARMILAKISVSMMLISTGRRTLEGFEIPVRAPSRVLRSAGTPRSRGRVCSVATRPTDTRSIPETQGRTSSSTNLDPGCGTNSDPWATRSLWRCAPTRNKGGGFLKGNSLHPDWAGGGLIGLASKRVTRRPLSVWLLPCPKCRSESPHPKTPLHLLV